MGQKWQKLQIQELLNEAYPEGLIFKMTLFSRLDLHKIMPKKSKIMKISENRKLCQATKVSK